MSEVAIVDESLGELSGPVDEAIGELTDRMAVARMWDLDHTLWQGDPTEAADRLGWLSAAVESPSLHVPSYRSLAAQAYADGLRRVVLCGMGGSSLFPEVLWRSFGARNGALSLTVLDTTHPSAIARIGTGDELSDCLFVVASKSGTTIETTSQLAHFWEATGADPARFVAITDPGTELAELGKSRGFRRVIEGRADIGGRFSALSAFGLVPGAMLGVELETLMSGAASMAQATSPDVASRDNPALRLAALLAAGVRNGRDKLTLILADDIASFGLWVEQLVAESTGKAGIAVVPIVDESLGELDCYGDDRIFVAVGHSSETLQLGALCQAGHPVVQISHGGPLDLGAHVLLWEQATALAGALLGINPFDQPDVASAKAATNHVLQDQSLPTVENVSLTSLTDTLNPGDYLSIQAFVDPGNDEVMAGLQRVRMELRDRYRVATTLGIGPRFLHSTGQMHKGGPPTGVFVQVIDDDLASVAIPGQAFDFAGLMRAQALGDLLTLTDKGRRAGRVSLAELLG